MWLCADVVGVRPEDSGPSMVDDEVNAGEGMEGEVTMPVDPAVAALFLRLKKDRKVLPGDGVRGVGAPPDPTRAATCFLLLRVQTRR